MQLFQQKKPGVLRNATIAGARTIDVPTHFEEEDKTFRPIDFTKKIYNNSTNKNTN